MTPEERDKLINKTVAWQKWKSRLMSPLTLIFIPIIPVQIWGFPFLGEVAAEWIQIFALGFPVAYLLAYVLVSIRTSELENAVLFDGLNMMMDAQKEIGNTGGFVVEEGELTPDQWKRQEFDPVIKVPIKSIPPGEPFPPPGCEIREEEDTKAG